MKIKRNYDREHEYVDKEWGSEEIFENNASYCGKLLICEGGIFSSGGRFHFHRDKDETFFVIDGTIQLDVVENEKIISYFLHSGDSFRLKPYTWHRFRSVTSVAKFIEASTYDCPDDSCRCEFEEC